MMDFSLSWSYICIKCQQPDQFVTDKHLKLSKSFKVCKIKVIYRWISVDPAISYPDHVYYPYTILQCIVYILYFQLQTLHVFTQDKNKVVNYCHSVLLYCLIHGTWALSLLRGRVAMSQPRLHKMYGTGLNLLCSRHITHIRTNRLIRIWRWWPDVAWINVGGAAPCRRPPGIALSQDKWTSPKVRHSHLQVCMYSSFAVPSQRDRWFCFMVALSLTRAMNLLNPELHSFGPEISWTSGNFEGRRHGRPGDPLPGQVGGAYPIRMPQWDALRRMWTSIRL